MLASPSFLYRLEADLPGANPSDVTAVLPYELATRLSYFLWNSMPDDELFAEAEAGGLSTPGGVEAQARRMLQDPRARDAVASFHAQWIGIDVPADQISKDASVFPAFDTSLMVAMQQETAAFAQHVVLDGDGLLPTLLTASFSFLNGPLAALYGVGGVEGEALVKTELDPSQRSGLFTHGSFLTVKSHAKVNSITHRGLTVRRRVLCQEMPPPPPDVDVTLPEDVEGTLRDKLLAITSAPECSACHVLMDPIGFGFENYDAIGQWRTQESGYPIDASGEVLEAEDASGPYVGSLELTEQLAQSTHVAQCVTTQWFQYAIGQTGTASEACAVEAFEASGRNVRELLVAITLSSAFRYRPALSP
jgi:hypothetical protein